MNIEEQIAKWHEILVPEGNYIALGIEGVADCYSLARYLKHSRHSQQSKIFVFGECNDSEGNRVSLNNNIYTHSEGNKFKLFKPLTLNPRKWNIHFVYTEQGIALEPLLEKPIDFEDFSKTLFGEQVPFEEYTQIL